MKFIGSLLVCICLLLSHSVFSQESAPVFSGFIRTGIYPGINEKNNKPDVSAVFADLDLSTGFEKGATFKSFAELQFRYGTEFGKTVSRLRLREGYVTIYGKDWDISAGQKIIRWGRADFTNPTSKLTPRDLLLRSPDREEMNLGNILAEVNFHISERLRLQGVALPLYRSSILIIDPIPLPSYVNVSLIDSFISKNSFSYGLRADFFLRGFDIGLSWFEGYDPMPGLALTNFQVKNAGGFPIPLIELSATPYRSRMLGMDFETNAGAFGFRGEAALTMPELGYEQNEFVPLPSVDIVAGSDWSSGNWRILAEYYGKYMCDFVLPEGESLIGTEPDLSLLSQLASMPGFDLEEYVRKQVGVFNRLYNYQLKRFYHSAAIRVESELAYGKIIPSLFSVYNFTSGDLIVMPEIKYKPSDGLTMTAGAGYYRGKAGSLYRIIDAFMNSLYVALRVDF